MHRRRRRGRDDSAALRGRGATGEGGVAGDPAGSSEGRRADPGRGRAEGRGGVVWRTVGPVANGAAGGTEAEGPDGGAGGGGGCGADRRASAGERAAAG